MDDPGMHFYDREIIEARERMAPIFGITTDDNWPDINHQSMEILYDHLISNVSFPFKAEFSMPDPEKGGEAITDIYVDNIVDPDLIDETEAYGLICEAREEKGGFKVPLSEIVIKQDDPNFNLIEDYCIWYWEMKNT
jgi:hypothetical protein